MFDKRFIERFLRLNNVDLTASEEEIRAVMHEARWAEDDVAAAIALVKGDTKSEQAFIERIKEKTFRPDMDWSSHKLSSLLGIDVVVDPHAIQTQSPTHTQVVDVGKKLLLGICTIGTAVIIAATVGIIVMYILEVGPFTQPVDAII